MPGESVRDLASDSRHDWIHARDVDRDGWPGVIGTGREDRLPDRVELALVPAVSFPVGLPARTNRAHIVPETSGGVVQLDTETREQCRPNLTAQPENEPPGAVPREIPRGLRRDGGRTRERDRDVDPYGDASGRAQRGSRGEKRLASHIGDPDA